jgi:acyl-CoA synthetase (AMP-forming)/AMP-acid ligase II
MGVNVCNHHGLDQSGADRAGKLLGLPYGSYARYILLFLQSQAVKTGTREIELGRSMRVWLGSYQARVGSVGLPSPGVTLAVVDDDLKPVPPDTPGVLAVDRTRSPLFFFTGYWRAATPNFQGDWYLTGDVMRQDADGCLTSSRAMTTSSPLLVTASAQRMWKMF